MNGSSRRHIYDIFRRELRAHARTARLNSLNLRLGPLQPVESLGELHAVEELALLGLHRAQRGARVDADESRGERGATQWAVLLRLGAVGSERVGQIAGWRGGVRARCVVDGFYRGQ